MIHNTQKFNKQGKENTHERGTWPACVVLSQKPRKIRIKETPLLLCFKIHADMDMLQRLKPPTSI